MAANPSYAKRQKELARQAKQRDKELKKKERRAAAGTGRSDIGEGEDPDLAGIVAGPQPPPEEEEADQ